MTTTGLSGETELRSPPIASDDDVEDVIALMRINYDRLLARHGLPAEVAA